jgi:hypothetical protein
VVGRYAGTHLLQRKAGSAEEGGQSRKSRENRSCSLEVQSRIGAVRGCLCVFVPHLMGERQLARPHAAPLKLPQTRHIAGINPGSVNQFGMNDGRDREGRTRVKKE